MDEEVDYNYDSPEEQVKKSLVIKKDKQSVINGMIVPWTEKYRPQTVEDLVVDPNIVIKVNKIIQDREMPNLIITGLPGIGKTSTILCIAMNILGKYIDSGMLESNASDERGIKAVQESITYFCKKKVEFDDKVDVFAKHKIVLLDEADNMTEKAQRLVNDLMEKYCNTTRFAFTCNTSSKIIEAIQSRCIIFRYKRLNNEQIFAKLLNIIKLEKVNYTKEGINAIVSIVQGDMRQAISMLQVISTGYESVTPENVYKLCDKPHYNIIANIFTNCAKKNFPEALKSLNYLKNKGYSSSDITNSMIYSLKHNSLISITEEKRIYYINKIAKTYFYISQGIDTPLQLVGCIAKLCL